MRYSDPLGLLAYFVLVWLMPTFMLVFLESEVIRIKLLRWPVLSRREDWFWLNLKEKSWLRPLVLVSLLGSGFGIEGKDNNVSFLRVSTLWMMIPDCYSIG